MAPFALGRHFAFDLRSGSFFVIVEKFVISLETAEPTSYPSN